jgi:hypothetical protein
MRIVFFGQRAALITSTPPAARRWRRGPRLRTLCVLLGSGLALVMAGHSGRAGTAMRHFDIETQDAASALNEFARQADITLVFSSVLVARHQTPAIHGDFTIMDALARLLDGSGLSFNQVSATTIAISAPTEAGDAPDPPAADSGAASGAKDNERQTKGDTDMNHPGIFARIAALFAFSGALVGGGHACGQQESGAASGSPAPADATAANSDNLQEIIVTATANGGVRKLDASFQITTASLEEIHDASPSSSADLLKIVPSIWAESGGGQAGPNIELAGYPGGSGAPYVT